MPKHKHNYDNNEPNKHNKRLHRERLHRERLTIPQKIEDKIKENFETVYPLYNITTKKYNEQETYQRWGIKDKYEHNRRQKCYVKRKLYNNEILFINSVGTNFKNVECELYHGLTKCKCEVTRFLCEFREYDNILLCPDCAMYENIVSRPQDKSRFNHLKNKKFGDENKQCYCCGYKKINDDNFHAGHVKSHKDNGNVSFDNMRPICRNCNFSMKDKHMLKYIMRINKIGVNYMMNYILKIY